jgi:hypothetical protein
LTGDRCDLTKVITSELVAGGTDPDRSRGLSPKTDQQQCENDVRHVWLTLGISCLGAHDDMRRCRLHAKLGSVSIIGPK